MRWRVTSRFRGKGVNTQVGLILFALLAGLLVPLLAAVYLAGRDQLPRSCRSGVSTSTLTEGAVTWSSGAVLWFADGELRRARRLADYTPPGQPARNSPIPPARAVTPSSTGAASPVASPPPGASPAPVASPVPLAASPVVEAAAISGDRRLVAFLVSNPPGAPGMVSLQLISPLDPPGTSAVEAWTGAWHAGMRDRAEVALLPDGHILFHVPARFNPPDSSTRLVGVAEAGGKPHLLESSSERDFLQTNRAAWPETKNFRPPPVEPKLESRVVAANGTAAGILTRELRTPLVRRTVHEVDAKSVRKKMKDKAFARSVSREDIVNGAAALGIDLDEHIDFCIRAMQARAAELGLEGPAPQTTTT